MKYQKRNFRKINKNVSYETLRKIEGTFDAPTLQLFEALEKASYYFQSQLFGKTLPPVMYSLNKSFRSLGYYKTQGWLNNSESIFPELNINPLIFWLPPVHVAGTLVHELCHHYQFLYGKPGEDGYHNVEFSNIMFSCGLQCSNTSEPGGKKLGRQMSHYIISGGAFEKAFKNMPEDLIISFKPVEDEISINDPKSREKNKEKEQRKLKIKYTCLECGQAAWGKPDQFFKCGYCDTRLAIIHDMGKR